MPFSGYIIIKPLKREDKLESGLLLPDDRVEAGRWFSGEVKAVAEYKIIEGEKTEMDAKVGEIVYFDEITAREFKLENEDYYCCSEDDVKSHKPYFRIVKEGEKGYYIN